MKQFSRVALLLATYSCIYEFLLKTQMTAQAESIEAGATTESATATTYAPVSASGEWEFQLILQQWGPRMLVTIGILVLLEWMKRSSRKTTTDATKTRTSSNSKKGTSRLLQEFEAANHQQRAMETKESIVEKEKTEAEGNSDGISGIDEKKYAKSPVREEEKSTKTSAETAIGKSRTSAKTKTSSRPTSDSTPAADHRPPIKATSNHHPGMKGFSYWYDTETSLYRIYTLGRKDDVPVVPPYVPHSHRGNVSVFLHVTNQTNIPIRVFWVNYQGKHILKGEMLQPNQTWVQTTYIDHPWVFEHAETQAPLLYYIPYRVIPTLRNVPTINEDGIGKHQFVLRSPSSSNDPHWISVDDQVMPHPGLDAFPTPSVAFLWTFQQLSRMRTLATGGGMDASTFSEIDTLLKYLNNILNNPDVSKYRQIRTSSARFSTIWMSPARGLLLALGFVEVGPFAELGCATKPLSPERLQDVRLLCYLIEEWKRREQHTEDATEEQPLGADGYGRQGFGRTGMNF